MFIRILQCGCIIAISSRDMYFINKQFVALLYSGNIKTSCQAMPC